MTTLYPTHHCFDDALEFIGERVTRDPTLAHGTALRLVHGICLGPRVEDVAATMGAEVVAADQPFAHAWVAELIGEHAVVWISGLDAVGDRLFVMMPAATFLATMRVQQSTFYTCRQAWQENKRSGHYGPWRAEYRALCRQRQIATE